MHEPPSGTVTFLFTDIEGSTRRWEQHPQAMRAALARHDAILRAAIAAHRGYVFQTIGDAFCAAFAHADDALAAALAAQRGLHAEPWAEQIGEVKVRMAMHTGHAELRGNDYFAPQTFNRLARILSATSGGQTVLSAASCALNTDQLPMGVALRDLGEHRLRDLVRVERLFQVITHDLPANFPPLKTLNAQPNNLPAQPTVLIGREVEVETVCDLLRRPAVRLVTLTGPGGAGKTRLSLQVAADLLDDFAAGVYFVPLAPISDARLVVSAIAVALGVKEVGEQPLFDTLKAYLRERQLLLVLDNFEQVAVAAPLVSELLQVASGLKALVSSRVVLHLYGEHEYNVPPLTLPDPSNLPPADQLARYAAVELFAQRAAAVRPDFVITAENASAIAGICARLDGLPLAIELAAARVKLLTPMAILVRLSNRLSLLTGGPRDQPNRQQTLRGAIDWSYDLLNDAERVFFARVSIFVGGCSAEAAGVVCDFRLKIADLALADDQPTAAPNLDLDMLDAISSLTDNSLLRANSPSSISEQGISNSPSPISGQGWGGGGEPRFIMLETIREYAQELLVERGEAAMVGQRHAEYALALAERAEGGVQGARQVEWLARLEQEHDNLRAALAWLLEHDEAEAAQRMSAALAQFWYMHGYISEGRRWLEKALASSATTSPELRVKLLNRLGSLAFDQGNYAEATRFHHESLALARELGNVRMMATALNNLGLIAQDQGDYLRSQGFFEEGLVLFRELDYLYGIANCLTNLGLTACYLHDDARAKLFYTESLTIRRKLEDSWGMAISLHNLAPLAIRQDDYQEAAAYLRESLTLFEELGDKEGIAVSLESLAELALANGEGPRAAQMLGAAETMRQAIGVPVPPSELEQYNHTLEAVRVQLDEGTFASAWAAGQAMNLTHAVAYALGKVG